ncbi:MAG TPA: hypothetical protein VE991_14400, partial [Acidimicrobiales bacterium]|nr:hypothetical protein [Acidimicrobiales bacterium]
MKRTVAAVWGAVCIAGAALAIPATTASAGSPNPITVAPGAPQSYSGSVSPGWTDPNGPPAPSALCSSNANGTEPCDRESVKLASGGAPATDSFSLSALVTFTPTDAAAQNCLDIAIEDSTATTVLAHQACGGSGATVSASNLTPGKTYIIEVDSDGTDAAGASAQPFKAIVSSTATSASGGPTPTPYPSNPFTFTHEVSVDVQRGDGEPDLAISSNNQDLYT